MTVYKGPNAFRDGMFKTPKQPSVITPRAPTSGVYRRNADAFNNKFPKSRYKDQSGGQSSGGLTTSDGGGLPPPPVGFAYIINADGAYLVNADDAYILAKV